MRPLAPLPKVEPCASDRCSLASARKYNHRTMSDDISNNKTVLVILSIFIPPLAVYFKTKDTKTTVINVLLCFLCGIPGIIHALYLVLKA